MRVEFAVGGRGGRTRQTLLRNLEAKRNHALDLFDSKTEWIKRRALTGQKRDDALRKARALLIEAEIHHANARVLSQ